MSFYKKLKDLGLRDVIEHVSYTSQELEGAKKVYEFLDDIRLFNRKVLIYGDYDPDGLSTILIWKEVFSLIRFRNYRVFKYQQRTHLLDSDAVQMAIEDKYDYIIVNDTASNEIDKINKLIRYGIKVILIDHHQTKLNYSDYPSNCAIVNSIIENRIIDKNKYILSAGALVYVVLEQYVKRQGFDTRVMACYALASLYADCIDMSSPINRGIYYEAMQLRGQGLPEYIKGFMNKYSAFTRRFLEYQWTPKINSVFRSERFELLNDYMLTNIIERPIAQSDRVEVIEKLSDASRELVNKITDILEFELLDNFVIANLSSVSKYYNIKEYKLYNYTGLIANKLASRHSKSAIVYCLNGESIKGSFRDYLSRNYLSIFQQFCDSAGHNAAFGIHINPFGFVDWLEYIKHVDKKFYIEAVNNRPLLIEHPSSEPDIRLLYDMARYNEFSGNAIPIALITKKFDGRLRAYKSPYDTYRYKWGDITVESNHRIPIGTEVKLKPTVSKNLKLYAV